MRAPFRRYALALAAVLATSAGSTASADQPTPQNAPQPAAPRAPAAAPEAPNAPGPASEASTGDPAWQLYDRAFMRLAEGDTVMAEGLLETLKDRYPGHPAAAMAATRRAELAEPRVPGFMDSQVLLSDGSEQPSQIARAELALTMTVSGIFTGIEICESIGCNSDRASVASAMLGSGASLGLSLYFTRTGITPGQSQALSSGLFWGTWNALMVNEGFAVTGQEAAVSLLARGVGIGLGAVVGQKLEPTSGQVALANSTALWTTAMVLMAYGVADKEPSTTAMAVTADAGLVLGSVIGRGSRMTRGRSLLIDAGGLLGFLTGGLLVAAADPDGEAQLFLPLMLGTGTGLALAAIATRNWDAPAMPAGAQVAVTPMGQDGSGWGLMLSLQP